MKNQWPAKCYVCGHSVGPGDGEVIKYGHGWRVHHENCDPKKKVTSNANP